MIGGRIFSFNDKNSKEEAQMFQYLGGIGVAAFSLTKLQCEIALMSQEKICEIDLCRRSDLNARMQSAKLRYSYMFRSNKGSYHPIDPSVLRNQNEDVGQ